MCPLGLVERYVDVALGTAEELAINADLIETGVGFGAGSVTTSPLTETTPAAINCSALRREARPAAARNFL